MNKLRTGQLCPLHRSYFCCGRVKPHFKPHRCDGPQKQSRGRQFYRGVTIIPDEFHPRGFRERCSQAELKRRKEKMLKSGQTSCFYCGKDFEVFGEIVVAHKEPKGMGGARHDDHKDNLTLAHSSCNLENGSKRPYQSQTEEKTA